MICGMAGPETAVRKKDTPPSSLFFFWAAVTDPATPQIMLRTTRDVAPGQELLLDYGDCYWGPLHGGEDDDAVEQSGMSDDTEEGIVIEELGDLLGGVVWGEGVQLAPGLSGFDLSNIK